MSAEFSRQIGKGIASIASGKAMHIELGTPVGGLCRQLARFKILAGCHQNSKNQANLHINMLKIMLYRQTVGNCGIGDKRFFSEARKIFVERWIFRWH
jgi:hypothetical protein